MHKKIRCPWVTWESQIYLDYHDDEWGVPVYDDRLLFEMLCLESAQAGLSWITILKRRENYRKAFENFEIETVANYTLKDVERLISDAGIIRNRRKIESTINNAQKVIEIIEKYGSLSDFMWQFVDGHPIQNSWKSTEIIPATSKESDTMSKTLKKTGLKFIGSTTCYALMQAAGMVNDHTVDCYRYKDLAK